MWFINTENRPTPTIPDETRVVVFIGGAGMLGQTLIEKLPPNVVFINVSRKRTLPHPQVINIALDVMRLSPQKLIENICNHVPRIDTLVYGAFMSHYKPLEHMSEEEMKYECELLALRPIGIATAFRKHAQSNPQKQNRVYVAIGSGVYKGLPKDRPDLGSYGASKVYLHYAMAALAKPLALVSVRTVLIHPGSLKDEYVRTKTTTAFWNEACSEIVTEKAIVHDIF
jgi:NAD(P)-dependent dehydrogenase (short-subunit alcohol dehydrogenase family)